MSERVHKGTGAVAHDTSTKANGADDPARVDLARARAALGRLRVGLPALSAAEVTAYASRVDEAECKALGARTKGANVAGEAQRWAAEIRGALATRPAGVGEYKSWRLAWLVTCLGALVDAIARQRAGGDAQKLARETREASVATAKDARDALDRKLRAIAGAQRDDVAAVDEAMGAAPDDDALGSSLARLAALAEQWIASAEATRRVLVRDASLTLAAVHAARDAAATLADDAASRKVTVGGGVKDGPEVNVAEGRVLYEMRFAREQFDEGRRGDPTVPVLVPGPATRAVLARWKPTESPRTPTEGDGSGTPTEGAAEDATNVASPPAMVKKARWGKQPKKRGR